MNNCNCNDVLVLVSDRFESVFSKLFNEELGRDKTNELVDLDINYQVLIKGFSIVFSANIDFIKTILSKNIKNFPKNRELELCSDTLKEIVNIVMGNIAKHKFINIDICFQIEKIDKIEFEKSFCFTNYKKNFQILIKEIWVAKFLVADDSLLARLSIGEMLEKLGHEVIAQAENGKEAYTLYNELKPDFVTMDVNMPEMDGIASSRNILKKDKDAKIIMITSIEDSSLKYESIGEGILYYLNKPFDIEELKKALENL